MNSDRVYLALGDSMSIDDYTGVPGGGAVNQFFRTLGGGWSLDDRSYDGCQMAGVPRDAHGALITLTIGGNDLILKKEAYLRDGIDSFRDEHLALLEAIRAANPESLFIVGDIYAPGASLSEVERAGLDTANASIHANCRQVEAAIAPIRETFRGHEAEYLCLGIEPTLQGAVAIARLFSAAYENHQLRR